MLKVYEIFNSVSGEIGAWPQGTPCTFIRFSGCNLACPYCDTPLTIEQTNPDGEENYKKMTAQEIIWTVQRIGGCKQILLTGGEPLIQDSLGLNALIMELLDKKYSIAIETNGTIDVSRLSHAIKIIMDYKFDFPPSYNNLKLLRECDTLKVIISNSVQLDKTYFAELKKKTKATVVISPITNQVSYQEVLEFIQKNELYDIAINCQVHKFMKVR